MGRYRRLGQILFVAAVIFIPLSTLWLHDHPVKYDPYYVGNHNFSGSVVGLATAVVWFKEGKTLPVFFLVCAFVAALVGLSLSFRWRIHRSFFDQADEGELTLKHWVVALSLATSFAYIFFYFAVRGQV